jgi:putative sterol carrier protein
MATQEEINGIFPAMMESFQAEKASDTNATIQFDLSGDNGGLYWVKIENGNASHGEGEVESNLVVKATADDFFAITAGNLNPMQAFMMGKIKVTDTGLAMKMMNWFQFGS